MAPGPEGFMLWVECGNTPGKKPVPTNTWKGLGRDGKEVAVSMGPG